MAPSGCLAHHVGGWALSEQPAPGQVLRQHHCSSGLSRQEKAETIAWGRGSVGNAGLDRTTEARGWGLAQQCKCSPRLHGFSRKHHSYEREEEPGEGGDRPWLALTGVSVSGAAAQPWTPRWLCLENSPCHDITPQSIFAPEFFLKLLVSNR